MNGLAQRERLSKNKKSKSSARTGVHKRSMRKYMESIGWVWTPTMGFVIKDGKKVGTGCQVHLKSEELPKGKLVVNVSRHSVAVIDGVIHDTYDPTREGKRCVYGYYSKP